MKKISRLAAVILVLALLCTGCSLNVGNLLQPPRMQGEQQAVQKALETYIRDKGGANSSRYTLKYPSEGAYTSAFVLCDNRGRPLTENIESAGIAVAFYALSSAPDETHVNLLHRNGDEWVSVGDRVGSGAEIRQVVFGDLDGDGVAELLTGWSTYNSKDHRLVVYGMADGLTLLDDKQVYTSLYVGDLTATGQDSLLLFRIGSGQTVTASLEKLESAGLVTQATAPMDGYIQQFGQMVLCRLTEGVHGLFVDAQKVGNTTITELLYLDDKGLHTPFYDKDANVTTVTGRASGLAARDVNGDAMVEIPISRPLPSAKEPNAGSTGYLTVWRAWDYATGKWTDCLNSVVNTVDGYLVALDDSQVTNLTTVYKPESHTLDLKETKSDMVWLRIQADSKEQLPPSPGMSSMTLQSGTEKNAYTVWYHPQWVDTEKVHYMVMRLMGEEGTR